MKNKFLFKPFLLPLRCFQRITFIFKYNAHYIIYDGNKTWEKGLMPLPYIFTTLNIHAKW